MSFTRSLPVFVFIFIFMGLWALGVSLIPARGTYAVLVCDKDVPDREIRERLENQGFSGLVSESGQWVLLDSFGSLEQVALDEYNSRILPFDPRNDGYAEKLRSLFVQDDKRFIYIPVKLMGIEKRLAAALGDIPYSCFNTQSKQQTGFFLILFCLAAGAFFVIRPLRLALRPYAAFLIPCLPALTPLALAGAAGFALASLLAGFAVLFVVSWPQTQLLPKLPLHLLLKVCGYIPCQTYGSTLRRLKKVYTRIPSVQRQSGLSVRGLKVQPYQNNIPHPFRAGLLIICYVFLSFFSGFSPVFPLLVLVFLCGILAFSLRSASRSSNAGIVRRNGRHQRFSPVMILKPRVSVFAFSWAMLPFAAAALILVFTTLAASLSAAAVSPVLPSPGAVTEADYRAHYLFQSTFSLRTLHTPEVSGGMGLYEFAPDGLLSQITDGELSARNSSAAIPPFPSGDLVRCLNTAESGGTPIYRLWFILLPLFFIFPVLFRRESAGKRSHILSFEH